jgi:hypothetical protein
LTSAQVNQIQDAALGSAQAPYLLVGAPYMACENGSLIKVGGIQGIVLTGSPNANLQNVTELSFTPSSLSNNTWYYVYAFDNAGTIGLGKTTSAPDNNLAVVQAANQRYLGGFKTNGSGGIYRFRATRGEYLWDITGETANAFRVLSNGAATSFTDVSLASFVPPHVRRVKIRAAYSPNFNSPSPTFGTASIRTKGGTGGTHPFSLLGTSLDGATGRLATSLDTDNQHLDMLTDSSQAIQYVVSDANDRMDIHVLGFREGL